MIFPEKCDACQINMTENKTSGTTSHKVNLKPELVRYIIFIHKCLLRQGGYVTRIKVYGNGRKRVTKRAILLSPPA